jgi:hypothetical protein
MLSLSKNEKIDKTESDKTYLSDNGNIKEMLNSINKDSKSNRPFFNKLLNKFKEDDSREVSNFLAGEGNGELLFNKIDVLADKSKDEVECLRFLVKLNFIIRNNAELGEYLMMIIPKLALKNTNSFVAVYKELTPGERAATIESLIYFEGPKEYDKFNKNLDLVDKKLQSVAQEIKVKAKNYIMSE